MDKKEMLMTRNKKNSEKILSSHTRGVFDILGPLPRRISTCGYLSRFDLLMYGREIYEVVLDLSVSK